MVNAAQTLALTLAAIVASQPEMADFVRRWFAHHDEYLQLLAGAILAQYTVGDPGVTLIPEPSVEGDATLNVNVHTPTIPASGAPAGGVAAAAGLPVLVWIHGGGYFAGSPASRSASSLSKRPSSERAPAIGLSFIGSSNSFSVSSMFVRARLVQTPVNTPASSAL